MAKKKAEAGAAAARATQRAAARDWFCKDADLLRKLDRPVRRRLTRILRWKRIKKDAEYDKIKNFTTQNELVLYYRKVDESVRKKYLLLRILRGRRTRNSRMIQMHPNN